MLCRRLGAPLYRYGDSCLSRVTTDVTLLKGLAGVPYVELEGKTRITLNPREMIADLPTPLEFFAEDSKRYHPLTPVAFVLEEPFYLKHQDLYYFVMRNQPAVDSSDNEGFFQTYGCLSIEKLLKKTLDGLPDGVSGRDFHNYVIRQVLEESERWKFRRTSLERLLRIIDDKIHYYEKAWEPIQRKLERKAHRRVKLIITLLLSQFAVVNYFVYFYLSWDIMEPFTVLFANLEVLLAYYFFVVNRKEYTYEKVSQNYFDNKKLWFMKREAFNFERYNELLELRREVRKRVAMVHGEPTEIVSQVEKPIRLLDDQ